MEVVFSFPLFNYRVKAGSLGSGWLQPRTRLCWWSFTSSRQGPIRWRASWSIFTCIIGTRFCGVEEVVTFFTRRWSWPCKTFAHSCSMFIGITSHTSSWGSYILKLLAWSFEKIIAFHMTEWSWSEGSSKNTRDANFSSIGTLRMHRIVLACFHFRT